MTPGTHLGPYEMLAPIGAGGMGEVWKARDTRLDRSVAIKVLPTDFAQNAQLKSRFEREARAISQLNHPNICTLHDIGCEDGVEYLVMELLEGETLADRLVRGAMPIDEVLRYGVQIASALDKAHRSGIVHRDLKPGNIMISKSVAKLLDFGLARVTPAPSATFEGATEHKPLTEEGTILGTFQYMAPEQLEGEEADPRTDIFALGAVLYEMATGRRAFAGKTKTSLIAAIVQSEPPPISAIQPLTPPALEHVVQKCLAKDRDDRWQSAHDIAEELRWISETGSQAGVAAPLAGRRKWRERIAWIAAAIASLLALAGGTALLRMHNDHAQVIHASLEAAAQETVVRSSPPAISPDGRSVAFCARGRDGLQRLCVRSLETAVVKSYEGTEGADAPFWSVDGVTIAFFAAGKLQKIELNGGTAEDVSSVRFEAAAGGSFAPDGTIYFSALSLGGSFAIRRISPGGPPSDVTHPRLNEGSLWPQLLPDGQHLLCFAGSNPPQPTDGVAVVSIDNGEVKRLMASASQAIYVSPGYLLYLRGAALMARPFDVQKLAFSGTEQRVASDVGFWPPTSVMLVGASAKQLVYAAAAGTADTQLVIVDGSGKNVQVAGAPARYYSPRISHDATRVAVDISDASIRDNGDIWIFDLKRGTSTRLTFSDANESGPVWRPDDTRVDFFRTGARNAFFEKAASGTGEEVAIPPDNTTPASLMFDWSPDGRWLLYDRFAGATNSDLWLYDRTTGRAKAWLTTPFDEYSARFSPDGRRIAYASNESGRFEVYVQNFPESSGKWLVSKGGGEGPVWSHDGHQLFYLSSDSRLMRVPVTSSNASFDTGTPQSLFEVHLRDFHGLTQYGVFPDGRFLLNQLSSEDSKPLQLVVNWTERLKR